MLKRAKDDDGSWNGRKMKHEEHVLERAEMYIGSTKPTKQQHFLGVQVGGKIEIRAKEEQTVPALYAVFDEIIVNAVDHHQRSAGGQFPVRNLKIDVMEDGTVVVYNDGNGIPIEQKNGEWAPTLCVGHLLTSENYDDSKKRLVGGRNGFGAALANIWSKEFALETMWVHPETGKSQLFQQAWKNNMKSVGEPNITSPGRKTGYTRVTFKLDYERFKVKPSSLIRQVLCRRACDIAAITSLTVHFNEVKISLKNYVPNVSKSYPNLYAYGALLGGTNMTYVKLGERWECVVLAISDKEYPLIPSFVNGVRSDEGGPFVEAVEKDFIAQLRKTVKSRTKVDLRKADIKTRVQLIVNAQVVNPEFRTQTKQFCTSKEFGSTPVWAKNDLDRAVRNIYPVVKEIADVKSASRNKRLIGAIQGMALNVPKYEGAKKAGSKKESIQCSIYLTEGDSAKSFVITGFAALPNGRKFNGVFPLKGKPINARKFSATKVLQNTEIQNFMKIVGLQPDVRAVREKLRYGRVVIVTDQDVDGSHIKGLIINFLHRFWPETLRWKDFVCVFHTPLVVVKWGDQKRLFFTRGQYDVWRRGEGAPIRPTSTKYYKGLATSSAEEAKEYFRQKDEHIVPFDHDGPVEEVDRWINIGFSDEKPYKEERRKMVHTHTEPHVDIVTTYPNFVKKELHAFWDEDNGRSLPHVVDGFKVSQRKIFYALRKKKARYPGIRVSQAAAYTSEHTCYEHAEASLSDCMIKMAQPHNNNIPLLKDQGMFGTRLASNDAGSPRYIYTFPTEIGEKVFPPKNDIVLTHLTDGDRTIEPECYVGVIAFLLVNGNHGIGTGVTSDVWSYNPTDIVRITRQCMEGTAMDTIHPWVKDFKGTVEPVRNQDELVGYKVSGVMEKKDDGRVVITELYPGKYLDTYIGWLRDKCEFVTGVETEGTEKTVHLEVTGTFPESREELMKKLRMSTTWYTTHMNAFESVNDEVVLNQYDVHAIVHAHSKVATDIYTKRRLHEIGVLEEDIRQKTEKAYYIQGWVNEAIRAGSGSTEKVKAWMQTGGFHSEDDFKPLRKLPNDNLFEAKIRELEAQTATRRGELETTRAKTPLMMWRADLDAFETYYNNSQ